MNFPIAMVLYSGAASELSQPAKTMSAEPCAIQSWVGLLIMSSSDLMARAVFGVDGPPNSWRGELSEFAVKASVLRRRGTDPSSADSDGMGATVVP